MLCASERDPIGKARHAEHESTGRKDERKIYMLEKLRELALETI
jgi:hypothetical protein